MCKVNEPWRGSRKLCKQPNVVYTLINIRKLSSLLILHSFQSKPWGTRMVVHRQLVEPAVCLNDPYDVFLLDIVRDTRQNLWTMIYRSQWPPNSMRSLTVSDWTSIKVWCISELFFRARMEGWISEDKWNFLLQRIWKVIFFNKESKSSKKKFWQVGGEGGSG